MYKPFTVELFRIQQYLKEQFDLSHFLQMPLSRDTVLLQDEQGAQIAFKYQNNSVCQIPVPTTLSYDEVVAYIRSLRQGRKVPNLKTFQDVTRWWASNPNPLTYQQALGLSNDLYAHFLTHKLLEDEDVLRLVHQDVITESEYKSLRLWHRDGNLHRCLLVPYGVDGTGDSYELIWDYGRTSAVSFIFYVKNEYYCFMHGIPYPCDE